jgi:hypothetical protein
MKFKRKVVKEKGKPLRDGIRNTISHLITKYTFIITFFLMCGTGA